MAAHVRAQRDVRGQTPGLRRVDRGNETCSNSAMDFRDSPKEAAFRAEARAFLEAHKPARWEHPFAEDVDEEKLLAGSKAWQKTLFENGWGAILWPREYGGRGVGPI